VGYTIYDEGKWRGNIRDGFAGESSLMDLEVVCDRSGYSFGNGVG